MDEKHLLKALKKMILAFFEAKRFVHFLLIFFALRRSLNH